MKLRQTTERVKVIVPVICIYAGVLDRISAMDHPLISNINADVRHGQRGAVRSGKENQVAGFRLRSGNRSADVIKSLRSKASDVPSAVIDNPRHKAGTVERR